LQGLSGKILLKKQDSEPLQYRFLGSKRLAFARMLAAREMLLQDKEYISKSMPGGDCVLRREFIHRPGVVRGCFASAR
jgi:hypothetical protein